MSETQWIFKADNQKCRLVRLDDDWYCCECKGYDLEERWMPYFWGTAEYMQLTELDHKWAIDKRK